LVWRKAERVLGEDTTRRIYTKGGDVAEGAMKESIRKRKKKEIKGKKNKSQEGMAAEKSVLGGKIVLKKRGGKRNRGVSGETKKGGGFQKKKGNEKVGTVINVNWGASIRGPLVRGARRGGDHKKTNSQRESEMIKTGSL